MHTMEKFDDIERVLANTPKPKIIEGPHRLYLRQSLIHQIQKEEIPMSAWSKNLKWACCLLLIAVAGGWTAQKVHKSFTVSEEVLMEEEFTNPDGSKGIYSQTRSTTISSDDPDFSKEKAQKYHQEIQDLIAKGKYQFVDVKELDSGDKVYLYKFTLSDGELFMYGTHYPLDYKGNKKVSGTSYREIKELISNGKGKLVEVKELDSGQKVYIYKITLPDGSSLTFGSDVSLEVKD